MYTEESTMVSQLRQFERRPRDRVETKFLPQCRVKGCQGSTTKVLMSGSIWSSGMRVLVRVTGILNAEDYQPFCFNNLLPMWDHDHLLLRDNATPQNAASTIYFLHNNGKLIVNIWQALSPDLIVIEHIRKLMSYRVECQISGNKISIAILN